MENEASITKNFEKIQSSFNTLTDNVQQTKKSLTSVNNEENVKYFSEKFTNDLDSIKNEFKSLIPLVMRSIDELSSFTQNNDDPDVKKISEDISNSLNKILNGLNGNLEQIEKCKIFGRNFIQDEFRISNGKFSVVLHSLINNIKLSTCIDICDKWKKIRRIFRSVFPVPSSDKKCYVLLIANSIFNHISLRVLENVRNDVSLTRKFSERNEDRFEIQIEENLTFEQTKFKLNELQAKDFSNYSSIVIIFESHVGRNEIIYPIDGNPEDQNPIETNMQSSDLWEWTTKNSSIAAQPVVVIVETGRGEKKKNGNNDDSKAVSFVSYPNSPNLLVVYAVAYGGEAHIGYKGSSFLKEFLSILEDINKKHWDILAQITEVSKTVLETTDDETKTVNFISLLTSQLKLGSNETEHDWKDVAAYQLQCQMRALFLVHNTMETEATTLKNAMQAVGIRVIETTLPYVPTSLFHHVSEISNPSVLFVVVMGLADSNEIHNKHMPKFRAEMSHTNCSALKGIPKVVFFLGSPPLSGKIASLPTVSGILVDVGHNSNSSFPLNNVSENSDVLAYCDLAPGWLESMQEILMAAPGNEEGLVRLLTTRGMARREALLSDSPPHIESSLRYKLVLPKTE